MVVSGCDVVPCYSPLVAYKARSVGESGKRPVVFKRTDGYSDLPIKIPCGKCIGCRIAYSRSWALRCVHEAKFHLRNSFVTVTYDEKHMPEHGSLRLDDLQRFFKRLRKAGLKFRYYACGEYGGQTKRPHYHILFFGIDFSDDRRTHSRSSRGTLFVSDFLSKIWGAGFCTIANFSYQSAAYVARYVMKKNYGANARESSDYTRLSSETGEIVQVEPEFSVCSRKPGIGTSWYDKYNRDAFPSDFLVHEGKKHSVPKFYFNKYKASDEKAAKTIKCKRIVSMSKKFDDNTIWRLKVREKVQAARLNKLTRSI